ncbi:hypothetical protein [Micromonospora sp. CA-111912]|uniref:hypothetical protein n=1 Tax=Micromonospora sp. CA-111912 TaxID=3239955 RepID=UPI003D923A53
MTTPHVTTPDRAGVPMGAAGIGCAALVAGAAPAGVGIERVVHRSDKAVVAIGRQDGQPVVAKRPMDDPYWVGRRQLRIRTRLPAAGLPRSRLAQLRQTLRQARRDPRALTR